LIAIYVNQDFCGNIAMAEGGRSVLPPASHRLLGRL